MRRAPVSGLAADREPEERRLHDVERLEHVPEVALDD